MGMRASMAGKGVASPRISLDSSTLKAGSRVLTVWVREMATAAKDRLAAMWPRACMEAGPNSELNSCLETTCAEQGAERERGMV
eukprot:1158326-Pelagomonas_calceolata.AAC.3